MLAGTISRMQQSRRHVWVIGPLVALAILPSFAAAHGFGDMDVVWAREAMERGDDDVALDLLRHFLSLPRPERLKSEARFLAARAALRLGEGEEAHLHLTNLEKELPEVTDFVSYYRGMALRQQGRWAEALEVWQKTLTAHRDSPLADDMVFHVADAHFALGDYGAADAAYARATRSVRRSLHLSVARFNTGRIAEAQSRWRDAGWIYRNIAFHHPTDPFAAKADERLQRLVKEGRVRVPSFAQRVARIDRLLGARSLVQARSELLALSQKRLSAARGRAVAYRFGRLHYSEKNFEDAIERFSTLAESSSGRRRLTYQKWVARCYSAADRFDQAIALYLEIAERYRGSRDGRAALFKAAWLAYDGRRWDEALRLFGRFVARYPWDGSVDEALWYMAWNAYRLGDLPTATSSLLRLREKVPASSLVQRTHYWEGRLRVEMGELDHALAAYQAAIDADPLSYYGVIAQQQRSSLVRETAPVAYGHGGPMLASLATLAEVPELPSPQELQHESFEPSKEDLPEVPSYRDGQGAGLPWGGAALDWSSRAGRRALQLMRLGLNPTAAALVRKLPALEGQDSKTVAYSRARLAHALGDFNFAYTTMHAAFGKEITGIPRGSKRRYFQMAYPQAHDALVRKAATEFGVSRWLVLAVMRQESAFRTGALSWANAHGLMQIIPPTAERIAGALGVTDFDGTMTHDPKIGVRFGAWYLAQLLQKFHGNTALALGSYNAGPRAMSRWVDGRMGDTLDKFIEEIPYRETRHYVKTVLGNLAVYRFLYEGRVVAFPEMVPESYLDNIDY